VLHRSKGKGEEEAEEKQPTRLSVRRRLKNKQRERKRDLNFTLGTLIEGRGLGQDTKTIGTRCLQLQNTEIERGRGEERYLQGRKKESGKGEE